MNSLVKINFVGKEKDSGKVFDTTIEAEAKKAGIFNNKRLYAPAIVFLGKGELINGLDEALQKMRKGEEKTIYLMPKDAFGERNPELVAMVPLKEFKERNIQPMPGLVVEINNNFGKVQSVSGGRVRVDFNLDLAGKEIEYWVKLEDIIEGREAIADALMEKFFPFIEKSSRKITFKEDEIAVELPVFQSEKIITQIALLKPVLAGQLVETANVNNVRFTELFRKKAPAEEKKQETAKAKKA